MYCKDIMIDRKEVISVTSDYTLSKALDRMDLYGFRTLPVVNYGRYLGVIDRNTIYEHVYIRRDIDLDVAIVSDVMLTNIQQVYGNDIIEKACVAFYDQRYQFVPVLMDDTEDQFMGIIPINLLLDIFANSLGLGQPAHRLTLEMSDYKGQITNLTRQLLQANANITSFVTVMHRNTRRAEGDLKVQIVVKFEGDLEDALSACRAAGAVVTHVDRYDVLTRKPGSRVLPAFLFPQLVPPEEKQE